MADWVGCFAVWLCCVRLRAKKRAMAKFICAPYSETINGSSIPATCNVAAVTGDVAAQWRDCAKEVELSSQRIKVAKVLPLRRFLNDRNLYIKASRWKLRINAQRNLLK